LLEIGFLAMEFSWDHEFGVGQKERNCRNGPNRLPRCCPVHQLWMPTAGNGFPAGKFQSIPIVGLGPWVDSDVPRSVGRTTPDAVYLSQEVDLWRPFDPGACHFRFEFIGSEEGARRVQTVPFEEKSEVVDISGAAENAATALAVLMTPIEVGIEYRFPGGVVGNFVVDENVDHDFEGTPFTVKRCSKWGKNASAGFTGELDRARYGA